MRVSPWLAGLVPAALIAAGLLSGCATFRGSKRIDVGPFSENTSGMVGALQRFNRPAVWTHLKKYQTLPSVKQVQQSVARARMLTRGVALYSSQIVAVYQSPLSEEKKISELARYMTETIRPNLIANWSGEYGVTPGYLDTLVQDIQTHKTLLTALGAAQRLVDLTASTGDRLLDQVDDDVQVAAADINARVEAEFAPLKARIEELDEMHVASVRSYTLLQRLRGGDPAALDSLRTSDPGVKDLIPSGRAPAPRDLDAAERYVIDRTTTIKSLRDQIEPAFTIYRENQAELEELRNQTDERARLARMTLVMWQRSHRNLAAGISVAPMIDVTGMLRSTLSAGAKTVF
jgi:hypothetical protein